jgi:hypothetical protein
MSMQYRTVAYLRRMWVSHQARPQLKRRRTVRRHDSFSSSLPGTAFAGARPSSHEYAADLDADTYGVADDGTPNSRTGASSDAHAVSNTHALSHGHCDGHTHYGTHRHLSPTSRGRQRADSDVPLRFRVT